MISFLVACARNHPPEIRAMDAPQVLQEGQPVEVLVEVADEDGADDLVAGWVEVEGAEVARLQEYGVAGTFVAVVGWEDVAPRLPEGPRDPGFDLEVVVTDTAGERASRTRRLRVDCLGADPGWCASRCVDLASDADHCGACGDACAADRVCAVAECVGEPEWTRCQENDGERIDCEAICAARDKRCVPDCVASDELRDAYLVYADAEQACEDIDPGTRIVSGDGEGCAVLRESALDPIWARCCCQ